MKVTKVDISKKILEVRDGTPVYWEVEYDPKNIMARTQGEIPDQVTVKQNAYLIQQVYEGMNKEERYYAVKSDDRGLFDDLIAVSNSIWEEKLAKAKEDGFWDGEHKGFQKGEKHMLDAFRALSWYDRLFKKF